MTNDNPLHAIKARIFKPERVMVFIDGSNIMYCSRKIRPGFRVDYHRMAQALCGDRNLVRTYFFCSEDIENPNPKQRGFLNALRERGIEVFSHPLKSRTTRSGEVIRIEKGVDVTMVSVLLRNAFIEAFDVAIVVTGDGDFVVAVQTVKDRGKRVEVASFEDSIALGLRRVADKFTSLDALAEEIQWKHGTTDG
jgi:uncharacterized LabA/DUF88 family protein